MRKNTDEELKIFEKLYNNKYRSPLIKWYQTTMTKEEKFKLGLLTYEEYLEWQEELARNANGDSDTFWRNDDANRENLSKEEYDDFLANNSIDIANKSAVDFDALFAEINGEKPPLPEPDLDEILKNVQKSIHGGNTILSEEEIAALFAAANGED